MKYRFMIAAPRSGSGKTCVSWGLMALLRSKGYEVQPFKCGPDYIDTKFHTAVCGHPSVNLDTFMASGEHVRNLYLRYGAGADVCVVEGMMGLFDGYDRDRGSSAEIAATVGLPIVLVVDAHGAAWSLAALIHGFTDFCRDARVCGVIFNKVGGARHVEMLSQICEELGLTCFGYIPKVGESYDWNGFRFKVKEMDGVRIGKILVFKEVDNNDKRSRSVSHRKRQESAHQHPLGFTGG